MSFSNLHLHIVYATKDRKPFLDPSTINRLGDYIGGITRTMEGTLLAANGTEDHIHLLVTIPPTLAAAELVRTIKSNSSKWIHKTFPEMIDFAWQDGYSVFSVSHSAVPKVISYIESQQEHHTTMSFQDELRRLLARHEIKYDERYL
ncbi:MAG: IS200/IS605 family transposase [Phycisphaerales bacterium]|jgi:putative transposase|nr:IS200/IS605 family transposase [Phycisphaerales bacterium]